MKARGTDSIQLVCAVDCDTHVTYLYAPAGERITPEVRELCRGRVGSGTVYSLPDGWSYQFDVKAVGCITDPGAGSEGSDE